MLSFDEATPLKPWSLANPAPDLPFIFVSFASMLRVAPFPCYSSPPALSADSLHLWVVCSRSTCPKVQSGQVAARSWRMKPIYWRVPVGSYSLAWPLLEEFCYGQVLGSAYWFRCRILPPIPSSTSLLSTDPAWIELSPTKMSAWCSSDSTPLIADCFSVTNSTYSMSWSLIPSSATSFLKLL